MEVLARGKGMAQDEFCQGLSFGYQVKWRARLWALIPRRAQSFPCTLGVIFGGLGGHWMQRYRATSFGVDTTFVDTGKLPLRG